MKYLTADGVELESVERVAKLADVALWPAPGKPFLSEAGEESIPERTAVLVGGLTNERLARFLDYPVQAVIDANVMNRSIVRFLQEESKSVLERSVGILLSSRTVFECDIAQIFAERLQKRLNFSPEQFADIHLAMHEALVNGLTHGNLKLSSKMRQSSKDLAKYMKMLSGRIKDPLFARKAISILASWNADKLEVKIKDEGAGYSVQQAMSKVPNVCAKSGRGLRIIAGMADSCTIDDFGREIKLSFLIKDSAPYRSLDVAGQQAGAMAMPDLSQSRVLVVEDEKSNQILLGRFLNIVGITDIDFAQDGIEALHKVAQRKPDMIILDLTMPRMNGYEVLRHLKSAPETADIPVLIQTASDTRETRDQTFKMGATDFLTKPLNPLEFFARVRVHLENRMLVKSLQEQLHQIDSEMITAQKMQVQILPSADALKNVEKQYRLDIAYYFQPSSRLGGDFWQMFPITEKQLGIYICDFSGHGVSAALNTFRLHAIVASMHHKAHKPALFLKELNDQLVGLLPRGQYATFWFGIWDFAKKEVRYSGAGALPPILRHGAKKTFLKTAGLPLGISKTATYDEKKVKFAPGDVMLLFSDALTEAPNERGIRMGEVVFARLIAKDLEIPNARLGIDAIMAKVHQHAKPPLPDDATAVLIRGLTGGHE